MKDLNRNKMTIQLDELMKAIALLADQKDTKVTLKQSGKGAAICGGITFVGKTHCYLQTKELSIFELLRCKIRNKNSYNLVNFDFICCRWTFSRSR